MFGKLAHLVYRRRWYVVGAWIVLLIISIGLAGQLGNLLGAPNLDVSGSQSLRASQLVDTKLHQGDKKTLVVVVVGLKTTFADLSFRNTVTSISNRIQADSKLHAESVNNPIISGNPTLISKDAHAVAILASCNLKEGDIENEVPHLRDLLKTPGYKIYVTGTPASDYDTNQATKEDLGKGEGITLPILLIILLLVFGTVVGALLPLMLAACAILVSLALLFIFGHALDISVFVTNVVTIIGLGISIDYALFILYRFREELQACHGDVEAAIVRTMETTGRAIFFSGVTVAIGLATLFLTQIVFMEGLGLGGVLVPIGALLTAMTLFPAVLSLLGPRVNRLRVVPERFLTAGGGGFWHRLVGAIMRRPVVFGGIALVIMLALAFPVTKLQVTNGSLKNQPHSLESVAGADYMNKHFNGSANPIQILIQHHGPGTLLDPPALNRLRDLETRIRRDPETSSVNGPPDFLPAGVAPSPTELTLLKSLQFPPFSSDYRVVLITVTPKDDIGTLKHRQLVERIRDSILPAAAGDLKGDSVYVGGASASYLDLDIAIYNKFPYIIGLVLILAYLFLFYVFRSAVLPLKAVLLNLLSVGAAYGIMELVFQQGIGSSVLGFKAESGIVGWVPVVMFAFLFGLSMDYEVFMLSRIREGWLSTNDNRLSVAFGLEKTGRLITSAALIMVVAFCGFLIGRQVQLKQFGFGLAVSIALDATLIRVLLVPSIMELTGSLNWWVPRFLRDFAKGGGFLEGDVFIPPPVGAAIPTEQTVALPAGSKRQVAPAARRPVLRPPFLELATDGEVAEYPLKTTVAIGRSQDNDVVIDDIEVSRRHALLSWADGEATIRDLNSANGTTVNGQSISTNRPLRNGDVIGLGTTSLTYYNDFELARPRLASVSNGADQEHLIGRTLGIGRALSNDVVIADPTASRRHAQVALYDGQALVHDLDSANGTMVNGQRIVGDRELHDGDTITIGRTSLIYHNDLEARVPSRA